MSQAASAYARVEGDKYFTPAWATDALVSVEEFPTPICDPAAGAGHIVTAIHAWEHLGQCLAFDISPDVEWVQRADFLTDKPPMARSIITNPPYGAGSRLAVQFIERALALTEPHGGKVAMLLKVGFDSAKGRRHLFADHPAFAVEYRLTTRIRWVNLQQSAAGPTENHSWFVWDWSRAPGPAVKGYLPLEASRAR